MVVTAGLCAALTLTGASVALADNAVVPNPQEQAGGVDAEVSSTGASTIGDIVTDANGATGKISLAYTGSETIIPGNMEVAANSAAYVFV